VRAHPGIVLLLLLSPPLAGCVERTLTVTSDPPGALVEVNGEEFGRTPVTRDFTYYGEYDLTLRHPNRPAMNATPMLLAPWWQWPPFDLFAELAPWRPKNNKSLHFDLPQATAAATDPDALLTRGQAAQNKLPPRAEGSE
jgi:hypothetical protein